MACISILHVFVSHFAIGGGLYLVLAEIKARKIDDKYKLDFLKKLSKFFILVTLVFGALTGVGIWFIIGLINPSATEVLIHHFVWAWAVEWTFFTVEITSALLYFYGWEKMSAKNHIQLGWIYFLAAWGSLFVINGIVTFMLTPGDWLNTGNFWDGFFNPTFWSSLFFRTGICIMLAGIYANLVSSPAKRDLHKIKLVRYNAVWILLGLAVAASTFFWYWNAIPKNITHMAIITSSAAVKLASATHWFAIAIAVLTIVFGFLLLKIPKQISIFVALLLMALGLLYFGSYEWMRESIRKPYVITNFMYGNGVHLAKAEEYKTDGYLKQIEYKTMDHDADLFGHACRACHTMTGYRPLKSEFDGTDETFITQYIQGIQASKSHMPKFLGTKRDAERIASSIHKNTDNRTLKEIYGLSHVALGKKVFEIRCGKCHEFGGFRDPSAMLLTGMSKEDLNGILDMAGDFAQEMPDFTASEEDRAAVIEYLLSMQKEVQ